MNMRQILEKCKFLDSSGDIASSIALLSEAIEQQSDGLLYYERAKRNELMGNFIKALNDYSHSIEMEPTSERYVDRALLSLSKFHSMGAALEDFREAAVIDPENPFVHIHLATHCRFIGILEEAIEHSRIAVGLAPGNSLAHSRLGLCLADLGHLDSAELHLKVAIALSPDQFMNYVSLANMLRESRRIEEAKECMEVAVGITRSAFVMIEYARILNEAGELGHAKQVLTELQGMDLTEVQSLLVSGYLSIVEENSGPSD